MNDLDPAWLRSFAAIARAGSVTRAAQQVHRTQSAVSTHLQHLEAAVGTRLVQRSTRTLALTAQGLAFLPHALSLLRAQDDAHAAVGALATIVLALVYRVLSVKILMASLKGTVAISAMILFIIVGATTFAQILSFSGASNGLAQAITGTPGHVNTMAAAVAHKALHRG